MCATLVLGLHGEDPGSRLELITRLILRRLVERRLRPYQDAILVQSELVGPNPATIRTQHAMIGRERERAAVFEHDRYAVALALVHALGLHRHLQLAVRAGRKHPLAARGGQRFDAARRSIRERHWGALGQAGRAAVAHGIEPERLEVAQQFAFLR